MQVKLGDLPELIVNNSAVKAMRNVEWFAALPKHEKLVAEWERCSGGRWDRYAPLPPLGEADVFARAHRDCMRHYLIAC